jgi:hypothetical protein
MPRNTRSRLISLFFEFSESAAVNMLSLNFDARNLLELPPIPIRLALPFTQRKVEPSFETLDT